MKETNMMRKLRTNDECRKAIKFLYDKREKVRSLKSIGASPRELKKELKKA